MTFDEWPKCAVPACANKSCLSLKSKYCWPHTPGSTTDAKQNLLETEPEQKEETCLKSTSPAPAKTL
jgi:hypothetical protein